LRNNTLCSYSSSRCGVFHVAQSITIFRCRERIM
jgi:hypothetical protein